MIFENTTDPFESSEKILWLDIETHSAKKRWDMDRYEYIRLLQYAWNDGPVRLTTDLDHTIEQIEAADLIVLHNGTAFDLPVIYGPESTRPLELALEGRVFDTMTFATLVNPSRYFFTMRPPTDDEGNRIVDPKTGKFKPGAKMVDGLAPEKAKKWFSLDNQCYQLGVGGKEGDLGALSVEYAKKATEGDGKKYPIKELRNMGFGLIDIEDPRYLAYAEQDIISLRDLAYALRSKMRRSRVTWDYVMREMIIVSIDAQNTTNGFTVNIPEAEARVKELKQERDEIMTQLVAEWDFPTEGKKPWQSDKGKAAILNILASFGITPENTPDWGKTATGNISLGGKVLKEISKGTDAEPIVDAIAALMGQRSLAELALDSTQSDGKAHPDINRFQRSGRTSVQNPGLTIWTAHGPGAVEKRYFTASPGRKLCAADLSNADARIVAAYSGDPEYAKRFDEGFDSHEMTARFLYGDELYESDPKYYRNKAKPATHTWGFRGGKRPIMQSTKAEEFQVQNFLDSMNETYPVVLQWQNQVTREGERGLIVNDWGRPMVVDKDRSYTQSPALYGQSGTREIICDALIRMAYDDIRVITWLVAQVHDELIFDVPEEEVWWFTDYLEEMMYTEFEPKKGGQMIEFPASSSTPADNWYEAGH